MAVTTTKTNKPILPRGVDNRPVDSYNRAELYSGKALDFDGVNDSIDINNFSLNGYTAFSICFHKTSVFPQNRTIFSNADDISDGFNLYQVSPGIFRARLNGANIDTDNPVSQIEGFFVFTYDGTDGVWYQDGQSIGTGTTIQTLAITNTTSTIGRFSYSSTSYLDGQIAGFKIFNTALTAAQVADLYNNPEKVVPTGVADSALKLWLPMQEGAGTTAYDGSGNGNHGTIFGTTWTHGIGAPVAQTAVIDWNKKENLIILSEEINETVQTPGGWNQSSGDPLESSSEADPTGRNTASLVNVQSLSNGEYLYNYQAPVTSGEEYTFSIWAKLGTAENAVFVVNDTTAWDSVSGANYVATSANGYDEWKQVSITFTAPTTNKVNVHIGYHQETGLTQQDIGNFYIWGAAIHKGSTPILVPTFGTAQTSPVLLPQGLTTGRDITGVNLFENVRKQGALNLDGKSWAEVHDNASLDITNAITLEAWVYWSEPNTEGVLGRFGALTADRSYMLYAPSSTTIEFFINTSSSIYTAMTNGWRHIVGTYDGANRKLYVDGVLRDTDAMTAAIVTSDKPIEIGRYRHGSVSNLEHNDQIAQPRIYNRALTAEEIKRNYEVSARELNQYRLLDKYPSAAAAYSLRLLNTDYTGDAIVVRRASDNQTMSIGFFEDELDTQALESFCSGTDGFVTTWYDQSGNGEDATQTTSSAQPKIVSSGSTILENGKAGIYFDGISNFFDTPSTVMTDPNVDDYKSVISVIGVDRTSTDTLVYEISYASGNQVAASFNRGSSDSIQTRTYFGILNDVSEVLSKDQNLILHIAQSSVHSNNSYLDGNLFSGALSGRSDGAENYLGKGFAIVNFYKGTFQEFVFYNADQTSNRSGIQTNINDHYSIY